jgi:hypothetical protein
MTINLASTALALFRRWEHRDGEWGICVTHIKPAKTSVSRKQRRSASARCFLTRNQKFRRALHLYNHVDSFRNGLAYVVTKDGKHGYIDRTGKYVWEPALQDVD